MFPFSADHEQVWRPYPVDPCPAKSSDQTHQYTHLYISRMHLRGHYVYSIFLYQHTSNLCNIHHTQQLLCCCYCTGEALNPDVTPDLRTPLLYLDRQYFNAGLGRGRLLRVHPSSIGKTSTACLYHHIIAYIKTLRAYSLSVRLYYYLHTNVSGLLFVCTTVLLRITYKRFWFTACQYLLRIFKCF